MKILREFLLMTVWVFLVAAFLTFLMLMLLLCGVANAAPPQAPVPPQAPISDYWVVKPAEGSCGCAPSTSCVCGPNCVCYVAKPPVPKPNHKPVPQPIKRRVRYVAPCNFHVPAPAVSMPTPIMGGYMGGYTGGYMQGGGFSGFSGMGGGGFGGGFSGGSCGGGG